MFVNYLFAKESTLPPMPACLYEYVAGASGLFVRAQRPGLEAMIPVAPAYQPVRGLAPLLAYVQLDRRMPAWMLEKMLLRAFDQGHKEILFYARHNPWRITIPEQVQGGGSVRPVDPYAGGPDTVLEVHSHHSMGAFFSGADNHEEQAGFRLYAVLGRVNTKRPEIRVRVGIYGHFWEIPASWVFDLPWFVDDALNPKVDEVQYVEVEDAA